VGADIEEFLVKDGQVLSAIGVIGGDKHHPRWVSYGNLQEDNTLAEYAINPCASQDSFVEHVLGMRKELQAAVPGYTLGTYATHVYDRDLLISFGKKALEFGCSAAFNAWSEELMHFSSMDKFTSRTITADEEDRLRVMSPTPYTELRTAGGHVHFSYSNPSDTVTLRVIRVLDYLLGCWSVFNDPDRLRRKMYGRAGYCRIKPYGGEYRVLSNFWVQSEAFVRTVYELISLAVSSVNRLEYLSTIASGDEVQDVINSYNVRDAERIFTDSYYSLVQTKDLA